MIGSRPKKKKPHAIYQNGLGFKELDFTMEDTVLAYSDIMQGEAVQILNIDTFQDGQIVQFSELQYNDFETLTFELQ